jgi:putative ABC transport system substrate-binding protein
LLNHEIEAARSFGVTMTLSPVHDVAGIEEAIAAEAREPGGALVILPDSFTLTHRDVIVAAALHDRLPLTSWTDFARGGGLMSYWFDPVELYTRAASYIDRILKGANPAELPVQQPTKYSLIINLKTAKALSLTVPERVLDIADEVIE